MLIGPKQQLARCALEDLYCSIELSTRLWAFLPLIYMWDYPGRYSPLGSQPCSRRGVLPTQLGRSSSWRRYTIPVSRVKTIVLYIGKKEKTSMISLARSGYIELAIQELGFTFDFIVNCNLPHWSFISCGSLLLTFQSPPLE